MIRTLNAVLNLSVWLCALCAAFIWLAGSGQARSVASPTMRVWQKSSRDAGSKVHTPPAGSPERKAVMDGLRTDQKVVFKVHYLKIHGDWAWVDVTPLDEKGKAVAEGGTSLMHKENGAWKAMDLTVIPEDPDNPMQEPTPKFVKQLQKAFPGVPADIFPRSK